jgi:hypothetical protein
MNRRQVLPEEVAFKVRKAPLPSPQREKEEGLGRWMRRFGEE